MKNFYTDNTTGIQYEVKAYTNYGGLMITCYISEVTHPNRRFFRTTYLNYHCFWVEDFDTVEEGILYCLDKEIECQNAKKETLKKVNDFFKKG